MKRDEHSEMHRKITGGTKQDMLNARAENYERMQDAIQEALKDWKGAPVAIVCEADDSMVQLITGVGSQDSYKRLAVAMTEALKTMVKHIELAEDEE